MSRGAWPLEAMAVVAINQRKPAKRFLFIPRTRVPSVRQEQVGENRVGILVTIQLFETVTRHKYRTGQAEDNILRKERPVYT